MYVCPCVIVYVCACRWCLYSCLCFHICAFLCVHAGRYVFAEGWLGSHYRNTNNVAPAPWLVHVTCILIITVHTHSTLRSFPFSNLSSTLLFLGVGMCCCLSAAYSNWSWIEVWSSHCDWLRGLKLTPTSGLLFSRGHTPVFSMRGFRITQPLSVLFQTLSPFLHVPLQQNSHHCRCLYPNLSWTDYVNTSDQITPDFSSGLTEITFTLMLWYCVWCDTETPSVGVSDGHSTKWCIITVVLRSTGSWMLSI